MYLNYVISIALSESLTSLPFRYGEKIDFLDTIDRNFNSMLPLLYCQTMMRYTIKYMDMAKEGNMLMEETGDPESLR